jgi:DNA-directed RNA polymerase subunit RPC12/RpoP
MAKDVPQLSTYFVWIAIGLVGLLLAVVAVFVALIWLVKGRGQSAEIAAPAAVINFRCSACGKSLKTKAGSAGKTVKCPGCGVAVAVPAKVVLL